MGGRGRRGPLRRWLLVGALILVVTSGIAVRGLRARDHLVTARADLQSARSQVLARELEPARVAIRAAGRETSQARDLTGDAVWSALAALPYLGRTFAVAHGIAVGADELARRALPPALAAADLVDPAAVRRPDGTIDLARLTPAREPLRTAAAQARRARDALRRLPAAGVAGPVARARSELLSQASQLASAMSGAFTAVSVAPALLGADHPRRYFVLIQQTSESRGTGGLPGGFAVLEARRGRLRVTAEGSDADIAPGPVAPPAGLPADYVARYADLGAFGLWVNVNVSPDLPVVARVVAARWQQQAHQSIDGVVAVDAIGLADLLRGAGAIALPNGRQLAPDQIVDYLAVGQYRDFAPPTGTTGIDRSSARKQVLREIARAATTRLVTGGGSSSALLRGLIDALTSGHLHLAALEGDLERQLAGTGVDGGLPPGPAPVAYPVLFNSTGDKLDYFLDRSISYRAGGCNTGRRPSRIEVDLTNRAPASGLPPYLTTRIGAEGVSSTTSDQVTLTVYGTRGAVLRSATLDGRQLSGTSDPAVGAFREDGLPAWHLLVELPREQTRRVVLQLDEPAARGAARVPEQPLARPLHRAVAVPNC